MLMLEASLNAPIAASLNAHINQLAHVRTGR